MTWVLAAMISAYRRWISPLFPRRCKYEPTCSAYAAEAVAELGALRGSIVAAWRLLRCNPLSDGGIDDLADRRLFRGAGAMEDRAHRAHSHAHPEVSR
ncbi:MAG: membrane protein insertion efficiency factor YidD [Solirubrobacterales bacterium]|nr:membrane protein insertion efficiency factor YidD [Solirubrobacterales bacterium]